MSSTKGKTLYFNEKSMDYVTFGKGKDPLVIIPGLGDGFRPLKERPSSFLSRIVYLLSVIKSMFFLESMS